MHIIKAQILITHIVTVVIRLFESSIKTYCYKPDPIFYGSGSFYMGVELEIDDGGEDNANADELLCIGNFPYDRIYCKHDGSIENGYNVF